MKCDWEEFDAPDEHGYRKVRCRRKGCGRVTGRTPHVLGKIHATCRVWGWGDYVAAFFARLGITKGYVSQLTGRDCGCQKRQEKLNTLGERVRKWLLR